MGGGNGAKAATKREKNAKNAASKAPTSQLKTNAAAQTIQCDVCKQTFQGTSKQPILQQHVGSRHAKSTFEQCFPKFIGA